MFAVGVGMTMGCMGWAGAKPSAVPNVGKDSEECGETMKGSGHLSAAYCAARPEEKPQQVMAIYREITPVEAPPGSYTTVSFHGDYVGLAKAKKGPEDRHVNFSIWGGDASEVEPADKKYGGVKTRQFHGEGTGWAGRLPYPWKAGTKYQIYVRVAHENGQTIYSAWFGEADKHEWLLAGRIRKSGTCSLGHAGGFLEHVGKKDMEVPRCTAYGRSWVHDGLRWVPCVKVEAKVKDPENARFFQRGNDVCLELGLGKKSDQGSSGIFTMKDLPARPPKLPEEVPAQK